MVHRVVKSLSLLGFGVLLQCASPPPIQQLQSASDPTLGLPEARSLPRFVVETQLHRGDVNDLDVSRDGSLVVSVGRDKQIRLWWPGRNKTRRHWTAVGPGLEGSLQAVALSPDQRFIAAGGCHGCEGFWDAEDAYNVFLLDASTGRILGRGVGHRGTIRALAFSTDGKHLVSGSGDGTLRIWRVGSSGRLRSEAELAGHGGTVLDVAWFPNQERVVSASSDGVVGYWAPHPAGGWYPEFISTGHTKAVTAVEVSLDGDRVYSGSSDGTVRSWKAENGDLDRELIEIRGFVQALALAPDGKEIAAAIAGEDSVRGVHVLPVDGRKARVYSAEYNVYALEWSGGPEPSIVLGHGITGEIALVDPEILGRRTDYAFEEGPMHRVRTRSLEVAWSFGWQASDPFHVLDLASMDAATRSVETPGVDGWTRGWTNPDVTVRADFNQGVLYTHYRGNSYETGYAHPGLSCWTTAPPHLVLTGTYNGNVYVTRLDHREFRSCVGHSDAVRSIAVFDERNLFVSVGEERIARIWNRDTCELLVSVYAEQSGDWVAWSPLGFYASSQGFETRLRVMVNRDIDHQPSVLRIADSDFARRAPDTLLAILEAETADGFRANPTADALTAVDQPAEEQNHVE